MDIRKRYSEEQIIGSLKEAEADLPVKELCPLHGFSEASYFHWRNKVGGLEVSDANRLKASETENARLKRLLAESLLEKRWERGYPPRAVSENRWLRYCLPGQVGSVASAQWGRVFPFARIDSPLAFSQGSRKDLIPGFAGESHRITLKFVKPGTCI